MRTKTCNYSVLLVSRNAEALNELRPLNLIIDFSVVHPVQCFSVPIALVKGDLLHLTKAVNVTIIVMYRRPDRYENRSRIEA